ncbi:hypothetical protein DM02DRAFT_269027 [Periconia macrospinosa]|uniref:Uncharacterized protein n=1 Tax=Periconia macrospinosa TaxID=97972 RepID=A0A2V1D3N0_9PLEO|nr:hypothetical protein DM02DRAFT_269027 [Periconia macrospinosa]
MTAILYLIYILPITLSSPPPKSRGQSSLLLGLGTGAGGLEKHEDAVGSIRSSYRSEEGAIAGIEARGRSNAMPRVSLCVGPRLEMYKVASFDAGSGN